MFKKSKIKEYLKSIDKSQYTYFDILLNDYIDGRLKKYLSELGFKKTEVHIDWFGDIKILSVQTRYNEYFVQIDVDRKEIAIGYDLDEVDDYNYYSIDRKKDEVGIYDFLNEKIKNNLNFTCKCCGYKTLNSQGEYEICPICFWEDDPYIFEEDWDNANHMSLKDGQLNYIKYGSCEERLITFVRKPTERDIKDITWKPLVESEK